MASDITIHPSGLTSRPVADPLPVHDPDHGFQPPFSVDVRDVGGSETIAVCLTLPAAARKASWALRRSWRGVVVEITDGRNQYL